MAKSSDQPFADRLKSTKEGFLTWHQERYIFEISEMLCGILEQDNVKRSELAKRLGKSKGWITQALGGANLTERTIADLFTALGYEIHPLKTRIANERKQAFSVSPYFVQDIEMASETQIPSSSLFPQQATAWQNLKIVA